MNAWQEPQDAKESAFLADEDVDLGGIRCLIAGDRYVLLEFGSSMDLALNLKAISFANKIMEECIDGVIETLPMFVSVLVHYDSTVLDPANLRARLFALWGETSGERDVAVPSRLIEIPVCYLDSWTRACVEDYARNVKPIEDDPTFVARTSGLASPEEFARRHAFTQHWVGGVGFYPGLPDMMPLDPRCQHSIPKYDPPRLWTVTGAIGVGGGFTSIYPMNTPGGYHLIGRTPVPMFSTNRLLSPFRDKLTLVEPGDRIKFTAIDEKTFAEIEAAVAAGAYRFQIHESELFSLSRHQAWASRVMAEEAHEPLPW